MKSIKHLSEALKSAQIPRDQIAALAALQATLEARELALLETCDLNDDQAFAEVAHTRIKLEVAPRKRAVLEAQLGAKLAIVTAAVEAAFPEFNAAIHAKSEALRASLARHLKPIYHAGTDLERPVLDAWRGNEIAQKLDGLGMSFEFSTDKAKEEPEAVAAKMLERVAALDALIIPDKL